MSTLSSLLRRNAAHANVVPEVAEASETSGGLAAPVAEASVGLATSAPRDGFYVGRELECCGETGRSERRGRRTAGLFTRNSRTSSPRPSRSPERPEVADRCEAKEWRFVGKVAATSLRDAALSRPATPTAKLVVAVGRAASPPPAPRGSSPIPIGKAAAKPAYTGTLFDVPTKPSEPVPFARSARAELNKWPLSSEDFPGELDGIGANSPGTAVQRDWPFPR